MILEHYFDTYEDRKIPPPFGPLDENGIPLFDPKHINLPSKLVYHPTVIIQYALAKYNIWLENNDDSSFKDFITNSKWLINNLKEEERGRFLVWYIPFDIRTPYVKAPWISALTQGEGLAVLLRYHQHFPSESTEQIIRNVVEVFKYTVKEGGVLSKYKDGYFLQEVTEIKILNGCMTALICLLEFLKHFEDDQVKNIVDQTIKYLEKNLIKFDTGWWSYYSLDIRYNLADFYYHPVHVTQLKYLAKLLENKSFVSYSKKWEAYSLSKVNRIKVRIYRLLFLNLSRIFTLFKLNKLKYK